MQNRQHTAENIEGPARLRPEHMKDRNLAVVAGSAAGFRVLDWPIEIAKEAGRLDDPSGAPVRMGFDGERRWLAIRDYAALLHRAQIVTGSDSTQRFLISGASGGSLPDKLDTLRQVASINSHLTFSDRTIVLRLCDHFSLPDAVEQAEGKSYKFAVSQRVRTALDALIEARHKAERTGWAFDLRLLEEIR